MPACADLFLWPAHRWGGQGEIGDIEGATEMLLVIGKGDKERRVSPPQSMRAQLDCLWATHRNERRLCPDRKSAGPSWAFADRNFKRRWREGRNWHRGGSRQEIAGSSRVAVRTAEEAELVGSISHSRAGNREEIALVRVGDGKAPHAAIAAR